MYRYAETGERPPKELLDLSLIDRFGVQAVYGRETLAAGEIWRMLEAEDILTAYRSKQAAENWAKWANDHPHYARLLSEVETLINGND